MENRLTIEMKSEKEIRSEIEKYELLLEQANQAYSKRKLPRHSYFARTDSYINKLKALKWVVGDRYTTEG